MCRVVAVKKARFFFTCAECRAPIENGHCRNYCHSDWHQFICDCLVIVDDGTAQAWLRIEEAAVFFKMISAAPSEAKRLQDACLRFGEVTLHNADDGDEQVS